MKKSKSQKPPTEKKAAAPKEVGDDLSGKPDLPEEFLVVGIGASAGGIQALKKFFGRVPADSGMAYVVILHLSPDHDSRLAEVLQQSARIPVMQVTKRVRVAPNHIYVVPPNEHLTMTAAGDIEVTPNVSVEDRRAPVDIFFRTLAESHHARAVAVVLSGTGANGSMGIKRVKERGGAAFVQNPREAEFSEMPRNSIATDLIDRILNVAEIPAHIIAYKESLGTIEIPVEAESRPKEQQQALREIFTQLRLRTGHDFSNYKRATVLRRIERRINVRGLEDLPAYAAFVRENADEATALLKDLLISVTNFFRDREAFHFLETDVLPKIFHGKRAEDTVRIWVAGCATGEEAYGLAMLCSERTHGVIDAPQVQIFASDIDEQAISTARDGFYTLNDAADVSPERLRRFFTKENKGYRVRRDLREIILFANHNLLKDPAFSHLDMITCRNLLIYLNGAAQERVMETFHFALEPGGYLLLGNSETTDGAGDLYAAVSKEHHIYQSRHVSARIAYPIADSSPRAFRLDKANHVQALRARAPKQLEEASETRPLERVSYGDLHLRLLEQYTPSVLINEQNDIVHISGSAARFLPMKAGEPTQNILKLIEPELRLELRTALYQAAEQQTNVEIKNLKIAVGERSETINIYVRPVAQGTDDTARGFVLVLFETAREGDGDGESRQAGYSQAEPIAGQLEEELVRSQSQLRRTVEQFEVQSEELKASNEELQAMNEELRSAAEELETSKEELQSVNEELITVNQELKVKIEELSQSSSDFSNLIISTDIATIFLDRGFRVHTFTPPASRIFNLIPADAGRPISDITHRLEHNGLIGDAETVLENLQTIEREVRTNDGRTYLMRVLPYRTQEDRIRGVVATFLDITERKRAEANLAFLAEISQDLVKLTNVHETMSSLCAKIGEHFKVARVVFAEISEDEETSVIRHEWHQAHLPTLKEAAELKKLLISKLKTAQRDGDISYIKNVAAELRDAALTLTALGIASLLGAPLIRHENLHLYLSILDSQPREWRKDEIALMRELTTRIRTTLERAHAEEALRESEEKYRALFTSIDEGFCTIEVLFDEKGKAIDYLVLETNPAFVRQSGLRNAVGKTMRELAPGHEEFWYDTYGQIAKTGEAARFEHEAAALGRFFDVYAFRIGEQSENRVAVIFNDITKRKQSEHDLRRSNQLLQTMFDNSVEDVQLFKAVRNEQGDIVDFEWRMTNKHWNDQWGEMAGKRLLTENPAVVKTGLFDKFKQVTETGVTDTHEHYYAHEQFDGWFLQTVAKVEDGFLLSTLDITERKRVEEALAESKERLQLLIESASDYAIFMLTPDNLISSWNTGAEKVFGWTEEEVLGKSAAIIFTPEDREKGAHEQEIETALRVGRTPDERFHMRKDGSRFFASGVTTVMRNPNDGRVQGFVKIARDMTEQLAAERAVRDKELLQKLVQAQEDERKRIARDLHDELGQLLTGLRLKLEAVRKLCDEEELCGKIDETQVIAKRIDAGIDFLAWELRPAALDDLGLRAALIKYIKEWSHHSGVTAEFIGSIMKKERLLPDVETNLYRIAQEALNNVNKHAKAKIVEVSLEKRGNDLVVLIVADDGKGFNPQTKMNRSKGIGLIGMRERAALIGGSLEIESAPGVGTTIFVRVPTTVLKKENQSDE